MHEMAVDIQDGGFTGYLTHNVRIPDFIEHSFWHYLVSYYFHISRAGASPARTLYGACVMLRIGYGPGLPPPWPLAMIIRQTEIQSRGIGTLAPALASRNDYTSASTAPVLADVTIEA